MKKRVLGALVFSSLALWADPSPALETEADTRSDLVRLGGQEPAIDPSTIVGDDALGGGLVGYGTNSACTPP